MTVIAIDRNAAQNLDSRSLREIALDHVARAADLRVQADEEERQAKMIYASLHRQEAQANSHGIEILRRPKIEGNPNLAVNKVISLMEKLCIDETVDTVEGLDRPLVMIERQLGIAYQKYHTPYIGVRIANCEEAIMVHFK